MHICRRDKFDSTTLRLEIVKIMQNNSKRRFFLFTSLTLYRTDYWYVHILMLMN